MRKRLRLDDIISVLQQNKAAMVWAYVAKKDNDWVKKCMEYEVEGARPRGRPQKTWERDCGKRLSGTWIEQGGDTMDCIRWMKQIRDS